MQDSRKATQGDILVWNTGTWNVHTEKKRIEVRSFQSILSEAGKLELGFYLYFSFSLNCVSFSCSSIYSNLGFTKFLDPLFSKEYLGIS